MDPATRRLALFAGGIGSVLVVLIGASALTGHRTGEVPVVSADPRPIREKPVNPGGMKIDGAENDLFSGHSDTNNARLGPVAETPDTKAWRADGPVSSAPGDMPTPADRSAAPPPAPSPPAVAARQPVAPPVAAPANKPAVVASAPAKPAAPPVAPAKPAAAEAAHPNAEAARPAAPAHPPIVQLAALSTEEAAHAEWAQLVKKMPELLNGKQPNFSRIDREGRAYWRVRATGFADVAQARAFCEHVRAKGGGCSVTDF
jgi:hypothetical protein